MDFQRSLLVAAVSMLSCMLIGGFYVKRLPIWLQWMQYISFITYSFDLMLQFEFTPDLTFTCNEGSISRYPVCNVTSQELVNATISGTDVLDELNVNVPIYINFIALLVFAMFFRFLAYLSLRFLHRKH